MRERDVRLPELLFKTAVVHTVTYFVAGILAMTLLDYGAIFEDPGFAGFMRSTDEPLVRAGPLFQPLRGVLFGLAFYPLREVLFARPRGWAVIWLLLVVVGIFSTFGPSPGSVEGFVYTTVPVWLHFYGLPEVVLQSLALSWLLHYWVRHPERRWLSWLLVSTFVLLLAMGVLGLFADELAGTRQSAI